MSDHDFNTPPWFLDLVEGLGPIGLDPCSNATSLVKSRKAYTIETNGLAHAWFGEGLVFMNPPHSHSPHNIEPWMEKAHDDFITLGIHRNTRDQFVGLVPAKTDTAWFHDYGVPFHKMFLRGRMKFWQRGKETEETGKFAHLVLYAGHQPDLFKHLFREHGWYTR